MITEPAPAKINLALHVRRRRPDGYHDLETLFAFAQHGDVVRVEEAEADSFAIDGAFATALGHPYPSPLRVSPSPDGGGQGHTAASGGKGEDNLVTRARDALRATISTPPVAITLTKNLPIASGIGGGSADAAATLRALARLTGTALDDPRLGSIARTLGADVPACLHGRTALGLGRGDDLQRIEGLPGTPLLLVNPGVPVSTAAVFAGWDGEDRGGIAAGDLLTRARAGRNDLEPPARRIAPAIDAVLALLAQAENTLLTRMSGSGATCFALFADLPSRDRAAAAADTRGWWTMATTLM